MPMSDLTLRFLQEWQLMGPTFYAQASSIPMPKSMQVRGHGKASVASCSDVWQGLRAFGSEQPTWELFFSRTYIWVPF